MNALNDFSAVNNVKPAPFDGLRTQGERVTLEVPAKSVTVLNIE